MKTKDIKSFNSVKFMREQRDKLSKEYNENPEKFRKNLEKISKKYKNLFNIRKKKTA